MQLDTTSSAPRSTQTKGCPYSNLTITNTADVSVI
jgi:hypothetical protein